MREKDKKNKLPEPVKLKLPDPSHINREHPIDLATITLLATSEKLAKITTLDLTGSPIGAEGLRPLLSSPHIKGLRRLYLDNTQIGDEGCKLLSTATSIKALEELRLAHNQITAEGLRALLNAPFLHDLEALHLEENPLKDEGASFLGGANLPKLKTLLLMWTECGASGAKALAQASWLRRIRHLSLSNNPLEDDGAVALSKSPLSEIETLSLGWTRLTDTGATALANASWGATLSSLDLRGNQIGEAGALALSNAKQWQNVKHLQLRYNPLTPKAEKALLRALPNVRTLQLAPLEPGHLLLCPYCSTKVSEGAARCATCQQDITRDAGRALPQSEYRLQRRTTCHHCGAQRFEEALLCPTCKRWGQAS